MQSFPQNTYTSEKSEYFVVSTVLGKVLTELDESGAKKITRIYTGEGVLAEQRNFTATQNSPAFSDIYWNHEDIVTGSFQKIDASGQKASPIDGPGSIEAEPLGAIVPQNDPDISSEIGGATSPVDYRFGGDVNRPETGCEMGGSPIPCTLLSTVLKSFYVNGIGVRTQGMEGGQDNLRTEAKELIRQTGWRATWKSLRKGTQSKTFGMDVSPGTLYNEMLEGSTITAIYSDWSLLVSNNDVPHQKYRSPKRILGEFLKSNPDCVEAMNNTGAKLGLKDFMTTALSFVMLAASWDPVGDHIRNMDVFYTESGGQYRNFGEWVVKAMNSRKIFGVTTYASGEPVIWITNLGMNAVRHKQKSKSDDTTPGEVVFHESVHAYFWEVGKSSHEDIVKILNIDLIDYEYDTSPESENRKAEEDYRNSESLSKWIENGCKNVKRRK